MKDFMMLFHEIPDYENQPTPEEMQAVIKLWQDWIGGIAAKGILKSSDALGYEGKTLSSDGTITDGPYAEIKEIVGGYLICSSNNIDEVVEMAKGCPILQVGGKVEVRDVMVFDN